MLDEGTCLDKWLFLVRSIGNGFIEPGLTIIVNNYFSTQVRQGYSDARRQLGRDICQVVTYKNKDANDDLK